MTTAEFKQAKKEIDATKHEEFVDWRFEEWLDEIDSSSSRREKLPHALRQETAGGGYEWLRSAFHAGAKR